MDVMKLRATLGLDSSEYEHGLKDAERDADKAGKNMGGTFASLGNTIGKGMVNAVKVVGAAVGAATTAVTAFAGASVKAGGEFDTSMSQVAATMGKTVDEIGELRDFAMDMGAKTAFSATQAADALNYMALAGYDANQSMEQLPNVLNLAAAGAMDLATASDMVTDAQSALGLEMSEMTGFVDQLAKTSSKSNTSVSQLGEAILTVGGTAKVLAGGTTELNTALGILADNGVKGAEGGTALRNIILSLSAPTDNAAQKMEELGLKVFDDAGNMRELDDIMASLNNSLSTLSQEERTQALNKIFNKVDLKSVNALLDTSAQRWYDLSEAIDDSTGAAEQMATTQLDNLNGDITLFKSALEGAQILVSDELTPSLRDFVQFGTKGLTEVSDAFKEGGLEGAMDAFGNVLSEGITMITEMLPDMVDAGIQLLEALGQGLLDNIDVIIEAAVDILTQLATGLIDALPMLLEAAFKIIIGLAEGLIKALPELIPAIVEVVVKIVEFLTDPNNLTTLVMAAIQIIIAIQMGLIQAIPTLIEALPTIIANLVMALIELAPQLIVAGITMIDNMITGLLSMLGSLLQAGADLIGELISAIVEAAKPLVDEGKEAVKNIIEGIKAKFADIKQKGKEIVDKVKAGFKEKVDEAKQWGSDLIQNFIDGVLAKWEALKQTVANVAQSVKDFLGFSEPKLGPLSNFHTYAPDMIDLFVKGINDNASKLTDAVANAFDFSEVILSPSIASDQAAASVGDTSSVYNINIYQPMQSASDVARAIREEQQYGLLGGGSLAY